MYTYNPNHGFLSILFLSSSFVILPLSDSGLVYILKAKKTIVNEALGFPFDCFKRGTGKPFNGSCFNSLFSSIKNNYYFSFPLEQHLWFPLFQSNYVFHPEPQLKLQIELVFQPNNP